MKGSTRTFVAWGFPLIPGMVLIFLFIHTCQRFEPDGFFNVNTSPVSGITANAAQAGGDVTDNGGSSITARGVCWDTSSEPTISDNRTKDGSGTGSFSSSLTGLGSSTTYYVRAYATNSAGTTYGDEESFSTTSPGAPSVTTDAATSVGDTSAILNGNVTGDGGSSVTDRGFYYGPSQDPVTSGTKVSEGSGTGSYAITITGLSAGDIYYFVAYATNSVGTGYGSEISFTTDKPDITGQTGTLTDYDGATYNWIGIGKQAWMAENLKVTHYANGTAIPLVEGTTEWDALTETDKAYCWYDNSTINRDTYGGLYTWAAAMNGSSSSDANPSGVQGVCPSGWHLPSDAEWKELEMYLGMSQVDADDTGWRGTDEGGKLKETGTTQWYSPNEGATNESGFSALPGGFRYGGSAFSDVGFSARFWSAAEYDGSYAWRRCLNYGDAAVGRNYYDKGRGFSVRCLRD